MKNKLDVEVRWETDINPDLSWLGEYKSNRPDGVFIDRENNIFVDPDNELFKSFDTEDGYLDFITELNNFDLWYRENYEYSDKYEVTKWFVYYPYYEELSYTCEYGRNSYRYVDSCNYPHAKQDEYKYVIQDNKMLEDYNKENWWMRGCIVTVKSNGVELGSASLWGLDSTMSENEDKEVIDDLTFQAKQEAKNTLKLLQTVELE